MEILAEFKAGGHTIQLIRNDVGIYEIIGDKDFPNRVSTHLEPLHMRFIQYVRELVPNDTNSFHVCGKDC